MIKDIRKPDIRFPGFEDDWEQRKLKDLADVNPKSILPEEFEYVDLESVVGTEMISYRTETKGNAPSRAQRLAEPGDIFFQTVRPYQKNNLFFKEPSNSLPFVFSTGYAQLRPNIDGGFLFNALQTEGFVASVLDKCTGTSYPAINSKDLCEIPIFFPQSHEEQTKIGEIFLQMDQTITLHQQKLDDLKELKSGLLQKMFPQKGEKVPQVRFPGFTGDWEQRKVKELAREFTGGGTPKTSEPTYWDGDIPWIQSSDLEEGNILGLEPQRFVSDKGLNNSATKLVPANSIAVVTRVGVGKLSIMPFEYATSQDFLSLSGLETDITFAAYLLYKKLQDEKNAVQGTAIKGITKEDLLNKSVFVPEKSEAKQIGEFLKSVDQTITLHQQKIDDLNQLKSGLLQKMFP